MHKYTKHLLGRNKKTSFTPCRSRSPYMDAALDPFQQQQSSPHRPHTPIHIHTDSLNNIHISDGQYVPTTELFDHTTQISLYHTVQQLHMIHLHHIKGHSGQPWNEMADAIAKHALTEPHPPLLHYHFPHLARHQTSLPYLSTLLNTNQAHVRPFIPQPLAKTGPNHIQTPTETTNNQHTQLTINTPRQKQNPCKRTNPSHQQVILQLNIVSANVRTLYQHPNRHVILQEQFHQRRAHTVVLQETRTKQTHQRTSVHYHIYETASINGTGGAEIWIHKSLPYAYTKRNTHPSTVTPIHNLQAQHITISQADPQLMLLHINTPHLHLDILNVHAGHHDR